MDGLNVEINDICRLCGENNSNLTSIETDPSLISKIFCCTSIVIQLSDQLPKVVCENCIENVEELNKLREKCFVLQKYFKNITDLVKIENSCRLCDEQNNLYQLENNEELINQINDCLSVQIDFDSHLPTTICVSCKVRVESFARFRHLCIRVQDVLQRKVDLLKVSQRHLNKNGDKSTDEPIEIADEVNNVSITTVIDDTDDEAESNKDDYEMENSSETNAFNNHVVELNKFDSSDKGESSAGMSYYSAAVETESGNPSWTEEMELLLITEIEKHPMMWDQKDPQYRARTVKRKFLCELVEQMNTKFQASLLEYELQRKWLNIKAYYKQLHSKILTLDQNNINLVKAYKLSWKYYEKMSFLLPFLDFKTSPTIKTPIRKRPRYFCPWSNPKSARDPSPDFQPPGEKKKFQSSSLRNSPTGQKSPLVFTFVPESSLKNLSAENKNSYPNISNDMAANDQKLLQRIIDDSQIPIVTITDSSDDDDENNFTSSNNTNGKQNTLKESISSSTFSTVSSDLKRRNSSVDEERKDSKELTKTNNDLAGTLNKNVSLCITELHYGHFVAKQLLLLDPDSRESTKTILNKIMNDALNGSNSTN